MECGLAPSLEGQTVEIAAELNNPDPSLRCGELEDAARADERIQVLIAPHLLTELECRPNLRPMALRPLLDVIASGSRSDPVSFRDLAIRRFNAAADPDVAVLYIGAAFRVDHSLATEVLIVKLIGLHHVPVGVDYLNAVEHGTRLGAIAFM